MKTRGRNYKRYVLSPQKVAELYGPPLRGRDKAVAELKGRNEDRMHRHFESDDWLVEEREAN